MPNWCNTSLVFEGDKQEIKALYQTMKKLERRKKPLVENGFGSNWLGCLVEALGGHWNETYCRGTWFSLECKGNILRMETETAWSPCIETYDFICKAFPSLTYYYRSEEIKQCMHRHRHEKALIPPRKISQQKSEESGIYPLDNIHVEDSKEDGLDKIRHYETCPGLSEVLENQSPEDRLFNQRRKYQRRYDPHRRVL